ncbi:hypothetical protein D6783_05870 [Candidatus Woesearchaeota archaeon]|nr:MAG: hypothetical protein D6783_05870 [Candidatus Woesearchaeota archaeon]
MKNARKTTKKAQIAVFVILGLVVFVAAGFFLYSAMQSERGSGESAAFQREVAPVRAAMDSCVQDALRSGLELAGKQGGFFDVSSFMIGPDPVRSEAFVFEPDVLPYWLFLEDGSDGSIGTIVKNKPFLCEPGRVCPADLARGSPSIQGGLEAFITKSVMSCFSALKPDFEKTLSVKEGEARTEVSISETQVRALVHVPLEVEVLESGERGVVDSFTGEVDVTLPAMYRLAEDIFSSAAETGFVESVVMQLISIYSGIESALPPTRQTAFRGREHFWIERDVEQVLERDVLPYVNAVQIVNAIENDDVLTFPEEFYGEYKPYVEGVLSRLLVKVSEAPYLLQAKVVYPFTGAYVNLGGGAVLKPSKVDIDLPLLSSLGFVFLDYKFLYDISFPYVVSIVDPSAFNGEGFVFQFALEANIRDNRPVTQEHLALDISLGNVLEWDEPHLLVDRDVHIVVTDAHSGEALSGVVVRYQCGGLRSVVGETSMNGELVAQLPSCPVGGVLVFEKYGALDVRRPFVNIDGLPDTSVPVRMWVGVPHNVTVKKLVVNGGGEDPELRALEEKDVVFLQIRRVPESEFEGAFPLVGTFSFAGDEGEVVLEAVTREQVDEWFDEGKISGEQRSELLASLESAEGAPSTVTFKRSTDEEVLLVPGTYVVDAQLLWTGNITIPEEKREVGSFPVKKSVTLPEIELSSWPSGGLVNFTFSLDESFVYGDAPLHVIVVSSPVPASWSAFENGEFSVEALQEDVEELLLSFGFGR